ncbi:MAG: AAA family ATPase [Epulopiscium sp.]|nr:AAA family ATPase [Candidatus Epulonipiscium sp.]
MPQFEELKYTQLKNGCSPSQFSFKTTKEVEPLKDGVIGQDRAVKAFDFGLKVKVKGYNIFMSGPSGTGKTTYAKTSTQRLAATEPVPYDWCYVYNFQNPRSPLALSFAAGMGKQFRDDMCELVQLFKTEIQKAFRSEDYERQKSELLKSFDDKRDSLMKAMSDMAKEQGFQVKSTNSGIYFMPVVDGKTINEEDYEMLDEDAKARIDTASEVVQEKAAAIMRDIRELEKESKQCNDDLDYKVGMFAIGHHVSTVQEKYKEYDRAIQYISAVQEDVLENIGEFIEEEEEHDESLSSLLPLFSKKQTEDVTLKYKVNLIVDHSETKGAPVVVHFNPTYYNLVGEVEYDSEFGNLTTDFMKIKGGLFHKANGGYLIVQAQDILSSPQSWEAIRRVIKTKEIAMESIREQLGAVVAPTLKPEPIPADFKIIMVGSSYYYEILSEYDDEFDKFFKIRADFDYEMNWNEENVQKVARFIKTFVETEKTPEFDVSAVCAVIEYSSMIAQRQDKLTTRFNFLAEILSEAATWAKIAGDNLITAEHVKKAAYEKKQRLCMYQEKLNEMLEERVIMIDTQGAKVGQINGLAVLDMGSYAFGNPTRITATTYMGKSGIVNIEKEAEMSGQTHDKGVQIITGYLGQTYAQEFPLSLSCRICFEQNYNGIDGDSASSTELYCILSSLSEIPIRQDLAVTGSINQRGEIQAIGGVTQKIEGFFDLCNKRTLTGTQGVIIPRANVKDLVLKDEVIEAVKNGKFHIYPISTLDEGIELLMGVPAGKKEKNGKFPANSVHGKVMKKLKTYYKRASGETLGKTR